MTSHELAHKLLRCPDIDARIWDDWKNSYVAIESVEPMMSEDFPRLGIFVHVSTNPQRLETSVPGETQQTPSTNVTGEEQANGS